MSSRALQKTDILHEIIEKYADLEGGCTTDEQRQQLASLCRVCKTFYDLAVKVLWARLPSLRPLLSLLPEFDYAYRLYIFSGSTQPFQCVSAICIGCCQEKSLNLSTGPADPLKVCQLGGLDTLQAARRSRSQPS